MYTENEIASKLRAGSPWQVHMYGDVASTMDEARRLATEHPSTDYMVAVAETQSAGLGRHTRVWNSSSDGVWMTALLRPTIPARYAPWFTLAAAVAVAESLLDLGFPVGIKWPNDVLSTSPTYYRRKVCGIRCEMELDGTNVAWVSLGIGINVNHRTFPEEIAQTAVSLRQLANGQEIARAAVAAAVLSKLEDVYSVLEADGFGPVRQRWLHLALGMGEQATVRDEEAPDSTGEATGIIRGMDEEGHLLLEIAGKQELHAVHAGDLVFAV